MTIKPTTEAAARILPITCYGDPKLEQPSASVDAVTEEIQELAQDMLATMYKNNGIGLAGSQVGRNIRVIVLDVPTDETGLSPTASPGERLLAPRMPLVLINPEVSPVTAETAVSEEGCLSFPKIYGDVERPVAVMLKAQLLDGETVQVICGGLLGRCLQHELDHLNGVVFVKRMEIDDRQSIDGELKKLRKKIRKEIKNRS